MSKINDGGPAFPPHAPVHYGQGMCLRDWFAGQCLIGLCQAEMGEFEFAVDPGVMARAAYKMADAMLAEREKRQ